MSQPPQIPQAAGDEPPASGPGIHDSLERLARESAAELDVTAGITAETTLRQVNETLEQQVAQRTAALRQSENRFRTLADATFEGVMLSHKGIIRDCNEQLGHILGCSSAELIGRAVIDFVPPEWRERVREALSTGSQTAFEHEALCKDGSRRIVETHGRSPEGPDGLRLTAIRDITERKQAEQELRESEMRFRQLAEVSTDAIAITEHGILVDGNSQLARLLGRDSDELLGRPVLNFVPRHCHELVMARMRDTAKSTYESYALHKNGTEIPVEITGQTMLWQGRPRRVTIIRDLTEERRAAEQREKLRSALERSRRMAEISEVSAAVVHQLGQPFSAITSNVSAARHMLKKGDCQPGAMDEALAAVESDLRNVRSIVTQLRALIHPEQARREPACLNQLVEEVLHVLRTEARRKRICIDFNPAEGLPMVAMDRVQISQVIFNLVRNAFDATNSCPPERRAVEIQTSATPAGKVELTVRDHGTGITTAAEDHIFDAFFTTKDDGMGIGLRISRTITKAHGGSLEGGNNPDGPGAWFRMSLPACSSS